MALTNKVIELVLDAKAYGWSKGIPMTLCAACHSKMERKTGTLDLRIRGDLYLVKNVVYEECGVCGEKAVSPEVSQMVYEKIKKKQYVEERISVPVLDFAAA